MSADTETIVIKRYASRRLYNAQASEYIALDGIADLIRAGRTVQIIDKKTGEDLTRMYLLQIISDQDADGEKVLPTNIMMEMVRAYKDQTSTLLPDFLSRSYEIFKEQQSLYFMQQGEDATPAGSVFTSPDILKGWQDRMGAWLGEGLTGNTAAGLGMEAAEDMMKSLSKTATPINPMANFDVGALQEQQKAIFGAAMSSFMPTGAAKEEPKASPSKDDELAEMKAQLAAMQEKLNGL